MNAPCISTKNSTASSSVKFLSIIDNNLKIFDFKTPLDKWFSSIVFLSSANKFADSFHSFQNIFQTRVDLLVLFLKMVPDWCSTYLDIEDFDFDKI